MMSLSFSKAATAASRRALTSAKKFSSLASIVDEFPDVPETSPEPAKASTVSVTSLSSGLIVATEDAASSSTVTMTYPKAGSGSELLSEQGAALINKCMAFKSASGLSTILINRTIEDEGATPFATADRLSATLGYTVEPENASVLVPLLAADCTFENWDVRDAKTLAAYHVAEANTSAQVTLSEHLYSAAYGAQSPMGRPFFSTGASTADIIDFRTRGYGLNGAILTATGVADHAAFVTEVEEMLQDSPAGTADAAVTPEYMGGESRLSIPSCGFAHAALAFKSDELAPMRKVLKHCFNIVGAEQGVASFESSGLVGLYANAEASAAGGLGPALTSTVKAALSADVVARAKTLAKAEAVFAMDSGSKGLAAAITSSVLETGTYGGTAELIKSYDAISEKDVSSAVSAMLKSNPSLAALGEIGEVAYQGSIAASL